MKKKTWKERTRKEEDLEWESGGKVKEINMGEEEKDGSDGDEEMKWDEEQKKTTVQIYKFYLVYVVYLLCVCFAVSRNTWKIILKYFKKYLTFSK